MDDIRRIQLEMDWIRDQLRRQDDSQQPTVMLAKIAGTPPETVPAWFTVQPLKVSADRPSESLTASIGNRGNETLAFILGPSVPMAGSMVICRLIGGHWVGETCCGSPGGPCLLPATPCALPAQDYTIDWGGGSATLQLTYGGFWTTDCISGRMFWLRWLDNKAVLEFRECYPTPTLICTSQGDTPGISLTSHTCDPLELVFEADGGVCPEMVSEGYGTVTITGPATSGVCCVGIEVFGCGGYLLTDAVVSIYTEEGGDLLGQKTGSPIGYYNMYWEGTCGKWLEVTHPSGRFDDYTATLPESPAEWVIVTLPPKSDHVCMINCPLPVKKSLSYTNSELGTFDANWDDTLGYVIDIPITSTGLCTGCGARTTKLQLFTGVLNTGDGLYAIFGSITARLYYDSEFNGFGFRECPGLESYYEFGHGAFDTVECPPSFSAEGVFNIGNCFNNPSQISLPQYYGAMDLDVTQIMTE